MNRRYSDSFARTIEPGNDLRAPLPGHWRERISVRGAPPVERYWSRNFTRQLTRNLSLSVTHQEQEDRIHIRTQFETKPLKAAA